MNTVPPIDVLIAVYNGSRFIEEAIASIQEQTWKNLRIIVADDGSTDNTQTLVAAMQAHDARIELLELPHRGVSATLNTALAHSTAPFVAFLDADDVWAHGKLEQQMEMMQVDSLDACFCMMEEFESFAGDGPRRFRARTSPLSGQCKSAFLGKRQLFGRYGGFDEQAAVGDFVEWFSRVVRGGHRTAVHHEVLLYRRVHDHNTTREVAKNAFLGLLKTHLDAKRKQDPQ